MIKTASVVILVLGRMKDVIWEGKVAKGAQFATFPSSDPYFELKFTVEGYKKIGNRKISKIVLQGPNCRNWKSAFSP